MDTSFFTGWLAAEMRERVVVVSLIRLSAASSCWSLPYIIVKERKGIRCYPEQAIRWMMCIIGPPSVSHGNYMNALGCAADNDSLQPND